jgi:hypothetical protein
MSVWPKRDHRKRHFYTDSLPTELVSFFRHYEPPT